MREGEGIEWFWGCGVGGKETKEMGSNERQGCEAMVSWRRREMRE